MDFHSGIDRIFAILGTDAKESVLVVADCGRIVDLVERHHVHDNLLVDVRLLVALDQLCQDVDGTTGLVTENLTRRDVVRCHNVGWLVLLNFTELGTRILELSLEDIHESCIEAGQDP